MKVDISADCGESFGAYKLGFDEELMLLISSANIACGWHAGIRWSCPRPSAWPKNTGWVGSCGFMDPMGFGRRSWRCPGGNIKLYHIPDGGLSGLARAEGLKIQHATVHRGGRAHVLRERRIFESFCGGRWLRGPRDHHPGDIWTEREALTEEARKRGCGCREDLRRPCLHRDGNLANRKLPGP